MGYIQEKLEQLEGRLISITRNTEMGWYELKIGLPPDWSYKQSKKVVYEVEASSDKGELLKIFPNEESENVTIDDLINYVNFIIKSNLDIQKKKEEFELKLAEEKERISREMEKFNEELEKQLDFNYEMEDDEQEVKSKPTHVEKTQAVEKKEQSSEVDDEEILNKINN